MNAPGQSTFFVELARDLRAHLDLCHECLALFTVENRRLRSPQPWQPGEFSEQRKRLLPRLESVLIKLRGSREFWQKMTHAERERCGEIRNLFQEIQNLLPRILMLDRENQQEMLRRGVLPAAELPAAAGQQPNFVANLYRRHAAA
jgi:hypothetical protein